MAISPNVAVRFGELDKAALKELAQRLQRNQSDTLRLLVRETLATLKERDAHEQNKMIEPESLSARRMGS